MYCAYSGKTLIHLGPEATLISVNWVIGKSRLYYIIIPELYTFNLISNHLEKCIWYHTLLKMNFGIILDITNSIFIA